MYFGSTLCSYVCVNISSRIESSEPEHSSVTLDESLVMEWTWMVTSSKSVI